MGNSQPSQPSSQQEDEEIRQYQELLQQEKILERVTRLRWTLEEVREDGIDVASVCVDNDEIIQYLSDRNVQIQTLILNTQNTQTTTLTQTQVKELISQIFETQRTAYNRLFVDGCEVLLFKLIEQLIGSIRVIRDHIQENVSSVEEHQMGEIDVIVNKYRESLESLTKKLNLYKRKRTVEDREIVLKSIGKLLNKMRNQNDLIRNVITVDTQNIIFDQTVQMHMSAQFPTLAGILMSAFGVNFRLLQHIRWIESAFSAAMYISVVWMISKSYYGNRIKSILRTDLRAIDKCKWSLGNVLRMVDDARSWLVIYGKPDDDDDDEE